VGFVEFFLAFALRREHASSWWFGVLLAASAIGSLVGSLVVPRLRRFFSEQQIIAIALGVLVIGALAAGVINGLLSQAMLTLVVGIAPLSAKPALDSIAQRLVPPALLGRAFGRIETRLQLAWVVAALFGTLIPFDLRVGDVLVAAVTLLALLSYVVIPRGPRRTVAAGQTPWRSRARRDEKSSG
jgi:predicted MFS family arabinose efflux permease